MCRYRLMRLSYLPSRKFCQYCLLSSEKLYVDTFNLRRRLSDSTSSGVIHREFFILLINEHTHCFYVVKIGVI